MININECKAHMYDIIGAIYEVRKEMGVGLNENHRAQLFNYMHLLKFRCGILVNFAPRHLELERYLYDEDKDEILNMYGNPI